MTEDDKPRIVTMQSSVLVMPMELIQVAIELPIGFAGMVTNGATFVAEEVAEPLVLEGDWRQTWRYRLKRVQ